MKPLRRGRARDRRSSDAISTSDRLRAESFRLLLERTRDQAIHMLDAQGRVATWNISAERMLGYTAEEIVGQLYSRFFTDEDRAAGVPERTLRRATEEGEVDAEGWRIRADGARLWASIVVTVARDSDGKPLGFGVVTRDFTARQEERERYHFLIDSVRDYAIFMMNPEGRVQSWNTGAERLKGYSEQEILGQPYERFFIEGDRRAGKPAAMLERARVHGRAEDEGWRVRKDGTLFWANAVLTAIRGEGGQLRGFAKVTRDTTERRRLGLLGEASAILAASLDAQQSLPRVARLSVPFLADWCAIHLFEHGVLKTVAVAHADPEKMRMGQELERLFPPEAETSASWRVAREGKPELYEEITEEMVRGAISDPELRERMLALGLRSAMIVPLAVEAHPIGSMSFIHAEMDRRFGAEDIHFAEALARRCAVAVENARAHARLRVEREFLETVVQQMPQGVIIFEADGTPLLANAKSKALLGLSDPRQLLEPERRARFFRSNGEVCPPEDWPAYRALRTGEVVLEEELELDREGERVVLEVGAAPVRDPEHRVVGAVALLQDVSERRKEAERAAQEARFRERFMGILGHDLRNPLGAILAGAHLLLRRKLPEPNTRAVERIASSAERMARMISDLLDLTRARLASGIPVAPRRAELAALGRKVLDELEIAHPDSVLRYETRGDTHAEVDPERIAQVLSNLIANAIQHGGTEPIDVRVSGEEKTVDVCVHNVGEPIPVELLPDLFNPFWRGGRPEAHKSSRGLGLGLFIAHEVVTAHKGTIDVRSNPEEGTTFRVKLPREFHAAKPETA